ncbi:MAG: IreB family regulatory phosphoprotein [Clostridia bacterium]|nr:IreB family regulatory phosphoprotein [Clostridia bacterium]
MENENTMKYNPELDRKLQIESVLKEVYNSLVEKGYDPTSQIVGYLLSGDPTYITSYNNARGVISRVERDEIIEFFVKSFLKNIEE